MNVVLGIDGGGTRTRASILARGTGSGSRRERFHQAAAGGRGSRRSQSARAAQRGLRPGRHEGCARGLGGVASASMPGVKEWITAVLLDFGAERTEVVGDETIALDAAFRGGPGILQIAGTGSNTVGRAPDGTREGAGGWSSRLGDEGSGYWIGVNSLRRALHAHDREQPTQVLQKSGRNLGHAHPARVDQPGRQHARTGLCRARPGDQRTRRCRSIPSPRKLSPRPLPIWSNLFCLSAPSCAANTISPARFP
jgi:N-acetylglucosamine kinase-like BadF-type ATPase